MTKETGRNISQLSTAIQYMIEHVHATFPHLLDLSPGVSECRRCRAVSASVGPVSGQCRLTLVSECRGVSGPVSGPVSGYVGLS